jgi:hypothetical protein
MINIIDSSKNCKVNLSIGLCEFTAIKTALDQIKLFEGCFVGNEFKYQKLIENSCSCIIGPSGKPIDVKELSVDDLAIVQLWIDNTSDRFDSMKNNFKKGV